jgi:hypothetical protein
MININNIDEAVSVLLEQKPLVIFQGHSEWGPRAVGNRSILFDARNKKAKEITDKNTEKREVGLIAQEINEILPEIVSIAPFDRENSEGGSKSGENYLTIQYEKVVPLLVECIKELKFEIEELKKNK